MWALVFCVTWSQVGSITAWALELSTELQLRRLSFQYRLCHQTNYFGLSKL